MANPSLQLPRAERDKLIEKHLSYAEALATKLHKELGGNLELAELVAYGQRGLVEAAERFDPTRGVAFTTFSYYRIRGAIFDGLRQTGWLSRLEYARYQASANELLENASERHADAPRGGKRQAAQQIAETLDHLATIFVTSLDAQEQEAIDADAQDGSQALEDKQAKTAVRQALKDLPDRERRLLELHYYQGHSLAAAGQTLGLSKSWSSRLHARAVRLLTERLGPSFR